ncbi:hypothetical protein HLH27_09360 [Gluconacetobacter takamatsuzukensis]|uniref:Uncharacterized protein n=1 Tax=Gluconacetobacter takamatsuzukensis TaxID=1286190 RepID=A0A7W4KE63_9PROT|nr:hypothetical protein [Gluconacetobacter takamatsuzukensis]MBB2205220.1 hypothetical protein [Gluconacetobacter takamatsuzukensis]
MFDQIANLEGASIVGFGDSAQGRFRKMRFLLYRSGVEQLGDACAIPDCAIQRLRPVRQPVGGRAVELAEHGGTEFDSKDLSIAVEFSNEFFPHDSDDFGNPVFKYDMNRGIGQDLGCLFVFEGPLYPPEMFDHGGQIGWRGNSAGSYAGRKRQDGTIQRVGWFRRVFTSHGLAPSLSLRPVRRIARCMKNRPIF